MQPIDLLLNLRKIFSTSQAQRVIPILRRDPLVWAALQEDAVFQKMVTFARDEPVRWSPAWVGLVALTDEVMPEATLESLVEQAQQVIPGVNVFFEGSRKPISQPRTLREAAQLAIAMRQRLLRSDGGRPLLADIQPQPNEPEYPAYLTWQTPLACLLGIVSDPLEVLRSLMPKRTSALVQQWVMHAVLSNPFEDDLKVEWFLALLNNLPPSQQLSWLRQINLNDEKELVSELARRLLARTPVNSAQLMNRINLDQVDLETAIVRAIELQRLAGLYRYANQPSNARVMLQKSQAILQHWSAGLSVQDSDLLQQEEGAGQAVKGLLNALALGGGSNGMQSEILLSVPEINQAETLIENLSEQTTNPISQIFLASRIARTGDLNFAREMAERAVELWLQQVTRQSLPFTPQFAMDWHPQTLVQALADLHLLPQAVDVATRLEKIRPNDPAMNLLLSQVHDQMGDTQQAVTFAQLKAAMTPEDPQTHAWLAVLWGKLGKWDLAFQEQHQMVFCTAQPRAEDWSALARCAVELQDWPRVEEAADQALLLNPDLGVVLTMKGQAYVEMGRLEDAGKLLSRATLLAPEEPETWLQLAKLHNRNNNRQRALETLRAAVLAVPASAAVNFGLARECLENGLTSDALPYLRKAASLDPASVEITVDLGQTLCVLGHVDEATKLLEQARTHWPQHPNLAFAHAQAALAAGSRETALAALEMAIEIGMPDFDWYMLFARTILGKDMLQGCVAAADLGWVMKAEQALDKALALRPDDYEAMLLRAEVVFKKGNVELAYQIYEKLMERPEFRSVEYRWRVQAGLGQAALRLEHYESALVSLQEAVLDQPDHIQLHHFLAEAFFLSHLEKQAAATARITLRLAPDDLDNLTWYANLMAKCGEVQEALQALRTATQLAPDSATLWLKTAELTLKLGDLAATRVNLKQLLSLPQLQRAYLHQAANVYATLEDPRMILECLIHIEDPDTWVNLEIAYYAILTNQLECGLKAIQDAAQKDPDQAALYVVEADLLNSLKRPEASLACLEHALHLYESSDSHNEDEKWQAVLRRGLIPQAWLAYIRTENAVHDRLAKLFRQAGDFGSALHHAEKVLEQSPDRFVARLQVAELCEVLLLSDELQKVLAGVVVRDGDASGVHNGPEGTALTQLLTMCAELALESGRMADAGQLADQAGRICEAPLAGGTANPRLLALRARLAVREGDWQKAQDLLGRCPTGTGVWAAKAALDLCRWDVGLSWLENLTSRCPTDLNAQQWFAVGLASGAWMRKTGLLLGVSARLPAGGVSSAQAQDQFERASSAAVKSGSREALRWQIMGRAIFQPGLQSIRSLAAVLPGAAEAAVLAGALREINNLPGAIQVAEQYQDMPEVLFQLALCYLGTQDKKGVEAVRKAVALRSNDPLYHALRAKLCQSAGLDSEALAALEAALEMWPEEAEWHVWASQLADRQGQAEQVILHWDQALKLVTRRTPYAIPAGRDYLTYRQEQKAIRILEEAAHDDPGNSEILYLLGSAFDQAGQLTRALSCAEKAAELNSNVAAPALLCGDLSLRMGNLDAALAWGQKAVTLDGRSLDAVLFLAYVFEKRKNPQDALLVVHQALQRNLVSLELLLERARLVFILNGGGAALPLLKELKVTYPQQVMVLKLLAQAQMEVGDFVQAEQTAFQALRLDPEQPALNLLMGKLLRASGQLDQAIHYLSETIRQSPTSSEAFLELGQAYMDRREYKLALNIYQKAMKSIPQDFRPFYQAGLILRENKDYLGAEAMLRRAAELAPEDLNIRRQLGAVITLNLIHSSQEASSR